MNFAVYLALSSASLATGLGLTAFWMGRAPGWSQMRWFALIALGSAVYSAGNVATSLGLADAAVLLASRFQLAGVLVEAWAWYHLADHFLGRAPGPVERRLRIGLPIAALVSLVPGAVYSAEVARHTFAPWGVTYHDAVPSPLGSLFFAGGLASGLLVAVRLAVGWRRGVPHAALHTLTLVLMVLLATNDALAASGLTSAPYLLDIGILLPVGALAWSQTSRFVSDARSLQQLRRELEALVESRSRELARTEQALHQAERLASLGQFAAGVAHLVNNPAAVVTSGLAQLSQVDTLAGARPEAREIVADARAAMERISVLVRQLVDAGRLAGGALQGGPTPLGEAVEAALTLERARQPQVAFIGRVPEGTQVQTGPDVLARILGALVANAAQAVPAGRPGRVEVVAERLSPEKVLVEVVDDGVGMAPEVLRRAFDPFFSTRPEVGAGLGLPVALALTEGVGGALTVESVHGAGTRVRLVLPAAQA